MYGLGRKTERCIMQSGAEVHQSCRWKRRMIVDEEAIHSVSSPMDCHHLWESFLASKWVSIPLQSEVHETGKA